MRLGAHVFWTFLIPVVPLVLMVFGHNVWRHMCPLSLLSQIFGHRANQSRPLPNSMCRSPSPGGDTSRCAGCVRACPDIDPEKSYTATLSLPDAQSVYYGFYGLIAGFYAYFFLYSGDWHHYFSGDWSHVPNQLGELFSPGFYIGGHALPIPKVIAAPATLLVFVLVAQRIGRALEVGYGSWRTWLGRPLDATTIRHRCFSWAAFASINTFYTNLH